MVFKSAYQRSFRQPKWNDFTMEEFQRKLQYRVDRRSVEHQHQAWLWDSDDEEDVEEIPMERDQQVNKQATQKQTQKNNNEDKHSVQAWVNEQQEICSEKGKRDEAKEPGPKDTVQHEREDRNDAHDRDEAEQHPERKHRHHRHKHRSTERRLRNKEKTRESPLEGLEGRKLHPPFLAYGWANDAPTELRKTHNVLASNHEVYPAALRAAKRRQTSIQQKVKLHEEAIKKKELTPPLAEETDPWFPKEIWLTEYQRNFCKTDDLKRHFGR